MNSKLMDPIKYVVDHAQYVRVDERAIERYAETFSLTHVDHWIKACPFTYHELPRREDEIDRRFLADALAFCFWGYPEKWTIEYEGKNIDGWWALLATIQRALERGVPLLDGSYLADLSMAETESLFAGHPQIPLFAERRAMLCTIGQTLRNRYGSRFHNYLAQAPRNAIDLVLDIARVFPAFDDISMYKGEHVFFYKKAQLLVDELADELGVKIAGVENLPGKADYKIPALLRKLGMLVYSSDLEEKVDHRILLSPDSEMEIEIRACMLWANHLICEKLKARGINIYPMQLDGILWVQSQTKHANDRPYHLTLTTDY